CRDATNCCAAADLTKSMTGLATGGRNNRNTRLSTKCTRPSGSRKDREENCSGTYLNPRSEMRLQGEMKESENGGFQISRYRIQRPVWRLLHGSVTKSGQDLA